MPKENRKERRKDKNNLSAFAMRKIAQGAVAIQTCLVISPMRKLGRASIRYHDTYCGYVRVRNAEAQVRVSKTASTLSRDAVQQYHNEVVAAAKQLAQFAANYDFCARSIRLV